MKYTHAYSTNIKTRKKEQRDDDDASKEKKKEKTICMHIVEPMYKERIVI